MCLLVVRPKNIDWVPSEEEFMNAWQPNPHGFGLAYAEKGRIRIHKTLNEADGLRLLGDIPKGAPLIMHWRYMTHGSVTVDNCHPFHLASIRNAYWVGAHNGILSKQRCLAGKTDSESYLLTLRRVDKATIEKDIARLGHGKIACLSNAGEIVLANEREGAWKDGVWRSNDSMEYAPFSMPFRSYGIRSTPRLHRLTCDYCDAPPLWESDSREMLCDACATFQREEFHQW